MDYFVCGGGLAQDEGTGGGVAWWMGMGLGLGYVYVRVHVRVHVVCGAWAWMESESVGWVGSWWRGVVVVDVVVEGIVGVVWWWWRRVAVSRTGRGRGRTSKVGCSWTVSPGCRLGRMWGIVESVAWTSGVGTGEGSAHIGDGIAGIVEVKLLKAGEEKVRRGRSRVLI